MDAGALLLLSDKRDAVRRQTYVLVSTLLRRAPHLVQDALPAWSKHVLGGIGDRSPGNHRAMWDMVLAFMRTCPDCWAHVNAAKAVLPRLCAMLRHGAFGSADVTYPALLPLLSLLPWTLTPAGPANQAAMLLDALWQGLRSDTVAPAPRARQALMAAYIECSVLLLSMPAPPDVEASSWAEAGSVVGRGLVSVVRAYLASSTTQGMGDSLRREMARGLHLLVRAWVKCARPATAQAASDAAEDRTVSHTAVQSGAAFAPVWHELCCLCQLALLPDTAPQLLASGPDDALLPAPERLMRATSLVMALCTLADEPGKLTAELELRVASADDGGALIFLPRAPAAAGAVAALCAGVCAQAVVMLTQEQRAPSTRLLALSARGAHEDGHALPLLRCIRHVCGACSPSCAMPITGALADLPSSGFVLPSPPAAAQALAQLLMPWIDDEVASSAPIHAALPLVCDVLFEAARHDLDLQRRAATYVARTAAAGLAREADGDGIAAAPSPDAWRRAAVLLTRLAAREWAGASGAGAAPELAAHLAADVAAMAAVVLGSDLPWPASELRLGNHVVELDPQRGVAAAAIAADMETAITAREARLRVLASLHRMGAWHGDAFQRHAAGASRQLVRAAAEAVSASESTRAARLGGAGHHRHDTLEFSDVPAQAVPPLCAAVCAIDDAALLLASAPSVASAEARTAAVAELARALFTLRGLARSVLRPVSSSGAVQGDGMSVHWYEVADYAAQLCGAQLQTWCVPRLPRAAPSRRADPPDCTHSSALTGAALRALTPALDPNAMDDIVLDVAADLARALLSSPRLRCAPVRHPRVPHLQRCGPDALACARQPWRVGELCRRNHSAWCAPRRRHRGACACAGVTGTVEPCKGRGAAGRRGRHKWGFAHACRGRRGGCCWCCGQPQPRLAVDPAVLCAVPHMAVPGARGTAACTRSGCGGCQGCPGRSGHPSSAVAGVGGVAGSRDG